MATKTIGTILSLKDEFSKTLKGTNDSVKGFQNQIKHTQNNIDTMKDKVNSGFGSITKKIMGTVAAVAGIKSAKDFIDDSVSEAKESVDAETKLEAVLKNVHSLQAQGPEAYKKAKNELLGVADNLQKVGVIEGDTLTAGFQQLATFQLSNKEISTLSGGMADLLAQQKGINATSGDAVTIANMIGKAMSGNVGALSRVGISFTKAQEKAIKTGDATQRAATIAEVLKNNVGGVNEALAKTDQGKIQQETNAWGDMKEEIGKVVLQIKSQFAGYIMPLIPQIQQKLVGLAKDVQKGIDYVIKHKEQIKTTLTIIGSIIAGFKITKIINDAVTGINKVKKAIEGLKGLKKAGKLFSSIFGFSPQMLLIVAIIATIAGLAYLIIKNWTPIKAFFQNLWAGIMKVFNTVINAIVSAWDTVYKAVTTVFTNIYNFIKGVFDGIWGFIKGIINGAIDMINGLLAGINKVTGVLSKIPGVNIKTIQGIPKLQNGGIVKHTPGGILTNIGEGNKDEAIIPLDRNSKKKDKDVKVYVAIQGNVIGDEEFADQVGEKVAAKVQLALDNM